MADASAGAFERSETRKSPSFCSVIVAPTSTPSISRGIALRAWLSFSSAPLTSSISRVTVITAYFPSSDILIPPSAMLSRIL